MKNALKYVRWLYVHSKGARWQLTANVLLGTVNVALNMAFILVCKHLVDIQCYSIQRHWNGLVLMQHMQRRSAMTWYMWTPMANQMDTFVKTQ